MTKRTAWGLGLATITESGETLDVWYPNPLLGDAPKRPNADDLAQLAALERRDEARLVHTSVVFTEIDLDDAPSSTADTYLRLHLLSHRLVQPNTINLDGLFARLPNVVWTSAGPCAAEDFEQTRLRLHLQYGHAVRVLSVDKFPAMVDYVVPSGVRIGDGAKVRLGAHLAEGTVVMHAAFVNYNAGTLGKTMIEGRISQGVVIGDGSDVGGGASTMGVLSGGGRHQVSVGKRCLLGASSGLGISLGDDCVVEAGLYVTAGTKVAVLTSGGVVPDERGFFAEPTTVRASDLSGMSNILFRRNSVTGRVEALPRGNQSIELNPDLHAI